MAKNGKKKDDIDVAKTSKMLKAIADTDRLRLVLQLKEGEKNVGTLADSIGAEIVNVSHHLGVLASSGLVKNKKIGRYVYYTLNPDLISKDGMGLQFQLAGCTLVLS